MIEFIQSYPRISIIGIAVVIAFFISLVNYFVLDKDKVRSLRAKQKEIQETMKNHKDNPQKLMELQKESMSHMMESMKHSFTPMLITFLPIIFIFKWVHSTFATTIISDSWFWYYLFSALVSSIVFRKLFKLP